MPVVDDGLAAHLPANVMLVDVGRNLVRPVHEVIVRVGALEEGMLIPIWIDGRLQGVLVPLAVCCHHTRPLRLGGREDIGGELVHQVKDAGTEELPDLFLVGPGVLRCDLLGGFDPVHVAWSISLGALLPLDGADLLANVVPGLDVQLVGGLGVAGFGDHMVADPPHLGAAPEGLDAQAFLVGVAVVNRDDPRFRLSVVVRVEVGHRLSLMVFIIGAADADSCSRLAVKCGGQRWVLRAPIEVVVLSRGTLVAAAEILPPPI